MIEPQKSIWNGRDIKSFQGIQGNICMQTSTKSLIKAHKLRSIIASSYLNLAPNYAKRDKRIHTRHDWMVMSCGELYI